MKQNIARALALTLLTTPALADDKASVEMMAGQNSATLDTKLAKSLDAGFGLFSRTRITAGYEGVESFDDTPVTAFNHSKLTYSIPGLAGLKVLAAFDLVPDVKIDPRVGAQYATSFGGFSLYQDFHVGADQFDDPSFSLLTNIGYRMGLTNSIGLVVGTENVTNFTDDIHLFSTQRLRVGIDIAGYEIGVATDLLEVGQEEFGYNAGGFVKVGFDKP